MAGVVTAGTAAADPLPTTLSVTTPSSAVFGDSVGTSATLSGASAPTGTIVVSLYSPSSPSCVGADAGHTLSLIHI